MRIEKNSGTLPSWLDSFVNKIQNKKVATKNVKNLPTVTWKNETYYVNLTDDGAVLYNDQANEVMSMDGVKSIEQVNDELNKDSVVASKTKLADDGNDSTDSQTITEDDGSGDDVKTSKSNYFDLDKTAENEDMPTDNDGMKSEIGGFGVPTDQIQDVSASINKGVEDISGEPHEGIQDIVGRPHTGIEEAGTDKYQNNAGSNDVEFENELAKVADLEDGQPQATEEGQENISTDTTNSGENQQEQSTTASINEGIEDVSGEPHKGIDDISGEPHETIEEAGTDKYQNNANSVPDTDINPDELVTKASYNRLLAKVKQLEKKLSAIDKKAGDYDGNGIGFGDMIDGAANAISNGASALWDAATGASQGDDIDYGGQQDLGGSSPVGEEGALKSKKDVKCKQRLISSVDKKAEGYGGGVGFDDIANGISNAWDTASGAVEDAFDWAQQQSQGENGTFDARDSKKDVKCKHRLIAITDESALKSFEQLNKESIPDTDDYSIDDQVNNSRGIDVGSVNNKKHLIADIPEGGMNLTDLPGYSDAVQDVDMNGREEPPSSSMSDDPDSNDLHNVEQFGGIFGKKNNKTAFTEAQHAYTAPENDAYDLNSQDEEVKHFNDSANQTQKVLDKEHALDLSNMNDRAKLNEYFLLDLDNDIDDMVLDDEEIVPDETVKELTTEELPQEEIVEEDSPAVEEIEIPVAEDIPVIEDENPTILVLDNPESIEEFENQTCPICHQQKSLAGVQNAGDYIGVVCNHCGQEYAVGNDKIFVRK